MSAISAKAGVRGVPLVVATSEWLFTFKETDRSKASQCPHKAQTDLAVCSVGNSQAWNQGHSSIPGAFLAFLPSVVRVSKDLLGWALVSLHTSMWLGQTLFILRQDSRGRSNSLWVATLPLFCGPEAGSAFL